MKEKEINYPTNILVFENGLILGDLCLTQMNCHFNISLGRIELDIQYHHKNKVAIKSYKTFITIEEEKETFKKLLPRFENIVREAENICITKSIVLKDMVPNDFLLEADLALCTIKETFAQCFLTLFARFQNTKDNFEEINRITKTKNNQLLVFLSENDLTIINENTGEILFNNRKIISNTFNTTFYCDSGDGKNIYAISKVNGILNTEPINTLYQIYSEDKQELNGMYIALTTKENLLLNNDGNFIDYIDKNQINEINKFNTLNKVNLMQTIANMSNIRPARKRRV